MILQAKKRNHKLLKHIDNIYDVSIDFNKGQMGHRGEYWCKLIIISLETMCDLINKNDSELGQPKYVSITKDKNKIILFPRPDTIYNCKIIGSLLIEQ